MIRLKQDGEEGTDAKVRGLQPEALLAIIIANGLIEKAFGSQDLVLTSVTDSHENNPKSLHNTGQAFDIRTRNITKKDVVTFINELKSRLGDEYDVVLEEDHIHVEFDPPVEVKEETQALFKETYEDEDEDGYEYEYEGEDEYEELSGEKESITRLKTIEILVRELLKLAAKEEIG